MNHLYGHVHGGEPTGELLDFSVNITPLPLPLAPLTLDPGECVRYPSIDGAAVRGFYAERFGLDPATVLPVSGAVEGIYLLPRALAFRRVLLCTPSFFEYERACRIAGAEIVSLPLSERDGFAFPPVDKIAGMLEGVDALFIGNPNNPTGTFMQPERLLELAERFPDQWFIVDEAFIQYAEGFPLNSLMERVVEAGNVIVIHSLTKFYALPALRLGAVIAHPAVVERLLGFKEPWTVNMVAEMAAGQLAGCRAWEDEVQSMIHSERLRLRREIAALPRLLLYGGAANFFLARWLGGPLDELTGHFAARGIHVRDCRNFTGLAGEWFRFAIRTPDENSRLLSLLQEVAC